jgi:thiamine transporter ThiT
LEPPDRAEKVIRFGCGFVAGVFVVGVGGITIFLWSRYYAVTACLIVGLVFGLLALKYGDAFWESEWFRRIWSGWWW